MSTDFTITEIFGSIQGESIYQGQPCTFIRLTGCPLRCKWCDTAYGFTGGTSMNLEEILHKVREFGLAFVELTGGEPLAQEKTPLLAERLVEAGYRVLMETSGALSIAQVPKEVHIIMDIKCPASGMADRNLWDNIELLKTSDEIKFVIASREDYEWGRSVIADFRLTERFQVSFSPAWGHVLPQDLASWIVDDRLSTRLNLQLHKYIWGPRKRGV